LSDEKSSESIPSQPARFTDLLEGALEQLKHGTRRPIIITGPIGSGKTTAAHRLAVALEKRGHKVGGIVAPRVMNGDETVGYTVVDLSSGEEHRFAGSVPPGVRAGRFFVSEEGLAFAEHAISNGEAKDIAFVDEVGRMELAGKGHARSIRRLLAAKAVPVLTIRDEFLREALERFSLTDPLIFRVNLPLEKRKNDRSVGSARSLWEIVDSIRFPLLITKGRDGFPRARPMRLTEREGSSFWFATSSGSEKMKEIEVDPRVGLLFVDTQRFNYAIIRGRARPVSDPDRKRKLWNEEWREDWPEGPADPDYVLLLIEGKNGSYHRGLTGESGEVALGSDDDPRLE